MLNDRRKRELGKMRRTLNAREHGRPASVSNKTWRKQTVHRRQRQQMDRASVRTLRSTHMARTNCDHLQKVETSWRIVVVVAGYVGIKLLEPMEKRESCTRALGEAFIYQ